MPDAIEPSPVADGLYVLIYHLKRENGLYTYYTMDEVQHGLYRALDRAEKLGEERGVDIKANKRLIEFMDGKFRQLTLIPENGDTYLRIRRL